MSSRTPTTPRHTLVDKYKYSSSSSDNYNKDYKARDYNNNNTTFKDYNRERDYSNNNCKDYRRDRDNSNNKDYNQDRDYSNNNCKDYNKDKDYSNNNKDYGKDRDHSDYRERDNSRSTGKSDDFYRHFRLGNELGVGAESIVYECRNLNSTEKCAVKISDISKVDTHMIEAECALLSHLNHPNIIRSHGVYYVKDKIHLVVELVEGEELHEIINQSGSLPEEEAIPIVYQLLTAINHLHENHICHRDVKPENILISDDGTLKLIDFGLAVDLSGTDGMMRECVGTQAYQAPEVLIGLPYNQGVDMWALGATTFTVLSGSKPFGYGPHENDQRENTRDSLGVGVGIGVGVGGGPTPEQKSHQRSKILNGDYSFDDPVWKNISQDAKDFVSQLMKVRPSDRITHAAALEHPWMTSQEINLRDFQFQWRIKSRERQEAARKEKRERMYELKAAQRKSTSTIAITTETESDPSEILSPLRRFDCAVEPRYIRATSSTPEPRPQYHSGPVVRVTSTHDRQRNIDSERHVERVRSDVRTYENHSHYYSTPHYTRTTYTPPSITNTSRVSGTTRPSNTYTSSSSSTSTSSTSVSSSGRTPSSATRYRSGGSIGCDYISRKYK